MRRVATVHWPLVSSAPEEPYEAVCLDEAGRSIVARRPYRIARQEHLGDMLDELQMRRRLQWRWDYAEQRAVYHVREDEGPWRTLDTKRAEQVAQRHCDELGIPWKPVPHPGGESQRMPVAEWIAMQSDQL